MSDFTELKKYITKDTVLNFQAVKVVKMEPLGVYDIEQRLLITDAHGRITNISFVLADALAGVIILAGEKHSFYREKPFDPHMRRGERGDSFISWANDLAIAQILSDLLFPGEQVYLSFWRVDNV